MLEEKYSCRELLLLLEGFHNTHNELGLTDIAYLDASGACHFIQWLQGTRYIDLEEVYKVDINKHIKLKV